MLLLLVSACELFSVSDLPTDLPATAADHCAPALAVDVVTIDEDGRTQRQPLADGLTVAVDDIGGAFKMTVGLSVTPTSSYECRWEVSVADVPGAEVLPPSRSGYLGLRATDEDGCLSGREWDDSIVLGSDSTGGLAAVEGLKTISAHLSCPDEAEVTLSAEVELVLFDPYADYEVPVDGSGAPVWSGGEGE